MGVVVINTIKTALEALVLIDSQHVVVRRKIGTKVEYLGGGLVTAVVRRFGNLVIQKSYFRDGVLFIIVF